MEYSNSIEKDAAFDIEKGKVVSHGADVESDPILGSKKGTKSLNKLVGGVLGFNGSAVGEPSVKADGISEGSLGYSPPTIKLLIDKNPGGQRSQELVPLVDKHHEKERRKGGKGKKAPKPPRPPKGPSLDAADMRLVKEISKIAMKKRERMERMKALAKMKAARLSSPLSASRSGGTISAMIVTILFFLVLIFQGLGSNSSSNLASAGAPQPAPGTSGSTPVQLYGTVLSNDSAAPSHVSQISSSGFSSHE